MCGIAGKIYFNGGRVRLRDLKLMTNALAHRGPDDEGWFIEPKQKLGFGSRRLSIIDLSKRGHMPMVFRDRYWITYNGEIYNFQALRKRLQKQGYRFRSQTDTEVILALYDRYGEKCLDHLRGMFALAIFDQKTREVFLARDRLGKKPLKYYWDHNIFIFASELKSILTQPEVKREPDYFAIHYYLTLNYTPAPWTGFRRIFKLRPGHYLKLNLNTKIITQVRYWKPDFTPKQDVSESEWIALLRKKLEGAVKLRMIADVPVGAFLSGGVDSSLVVGLMAKNSGRPVKTFSVSFKEARYDESRWARQVSQRFGTEHTEIIARPESIEMLPTIVAQYEEPYADASALVTTLVSRSAREQVKVVLNGDGGDENFCGYGRFGKYRELLWLENFPGIRNYQFQAISRRLLTKLTPGGGRKLGNFYAKVNQNYIDRYLDWNTVFTRDFKREYYDLSLSPMAEDHATVQLVANRFQEAGTKNRFDQALYFDLTNYFPEDLLVKVDIASMSVGLEARSPLADQEIVELAAAMPNSLKLKNFDQYKYILKRAFTDLLPADILNRPKMGFSLPLDLWFKGKFNQYARSKLLGSKFASRGLFIPEKIKGLLDFHKPPHLDYGPQLWNLLCLELWFQQYFD